jgi:hypothetical protein
VAAEAVTAGSTRAAVMPAVSIRRRRIRGVSSSSRINGVHKISGFCPDFPAGIAAE